MVMGAYLMANSKLISRIKINRHDAATVRQVITNERILFDFKDGDQETNRQNGLFGEIAAVRFLEKKYPDMIIAPLGLCSRMNVPAGFSFGDIIAVEKKPLRSRQVRVYEVKSTASQKDVVPLIKCDNAESYLDKGVSSVIMVNITRRGRDVICDIVDMVSPARIVDEWDVTKNKHGVECYKKP